MKLKKFRSVQFLEYAAAMLGTALFLLLPRPLALRLGEALGSLMYRLMRRLRAIGTKNLDIAFGDTLSPQEKQQIFRATFRNLGKSLVEVLHFPRMDRADLQQKVQIVGQEHFSKAMQKGHGVIYLTAHVGNWEMSGHAQSAAGYPLHIVVRPLDNQYLNRVVARLRTLHGNTLIAKGRGLKQMITALRKKEAIGILMDQNTLRDKGIFVDFFGKPACTTPVIALLALRYNAPVIPSFIIRTGFDTHTLTLGPEIDIVRTGDMQKDIETNTARFNTILEEVIRRYPDQWFWLHNRWKTQPEG